MSTRDHQRTSPQTPGSAAGDAAFVLSLVVTVGFYTGLVPLVPKTLPLFGRLVALTTMLFALAVLSRMVSIVLVHHDTATS